MAVAPDNAVEGPVISAAHSVAGSMASRSPNGGLC